jgi:molybdate transport system permease protein
MNGWEPLLLSAKVASIATIIVMICGLILGRLFARASLPGVSILDTLFLLPMVLPPSVIGFLLVMLLGKNGPLGRLLEQWLGIQLLFTWQGAVVAAVVVAFPLMYQTAKNVFQRFDPELEQAARSDGASEWQIFWRIMVPLSAPPLLAGAMLAFARSLGEFGATLMIAGNIPGLTQTAPLAVFFAFEAGDERTAWVLSLGLIAVSYVCVLLHRLLLQRTDD